MSESEVRELLNVVKGKRSTVVCRTEPTKRQRARPAPSPEALGYSITDACAMTGIGRTKLYEAMNDGRLQWKQVDGRRIIKGPSLRELVGA